MFNQPPRRVTGQGVGRGVSPGNAQSTSSSPVLAPENRAGSSARGEQTTGFGVGGPLKTWGRGNNMIRAVSGKDTWPWSKRQTRWRETPGGELIHQEANNGNLEETWACTQVMTAEGERDKQTLETTGVAALVSELQPEQRYKFAGESPGGRSDCQAQCSKWPSWSSGLGLGTSVSFC